MSKILADAQERKYAVGAFNFTDLVDVEATIDAAEEERAPVIIQIHPGGIDMLGMHFVMAIADAAVENASVPVMLHLDHCRDLETIRKCVQAGFPSVMMDGSRLPFAENLEITRKAVEIAHAAGSEVEAELGRVGSGSEKPSDRKEFLTDPEEARKFVRETGVDSLAVAIGSAHGFYSFKPDLDFQRLGELREALQIPLVLHGGSDLPNDQISRSVQMGIAKVNIHTDISKVYTDALREMVAGDEKVIWPGQVLTVTRRPMKESIRAKMRLLGSPGMAG